MRSRGSRIWGIAVAVAVVVGGQALPASAAGGALDAGFSGDGRAFTRVGSAHSAGFDVAVQNDGRIVVVGAATVAEHSVFALVRYNVDGSLDSTFGGDGRVVTRIGVHASGRGVALQTDGKIVVAGAAWGNGSGRFAAARYLPSGAPDHTFSQDGTLITSFPGDADAADVAVQSDGKIVLAGSAGGRFALARYGPAGRLDPGFGGDGRVLTEMGGGDSFARGVAIQHDGRIVVVGSAGGRVAVARYGLGGHLDASFTGDGTATTEFPRMMSAQGFAVALQSDGAIVVGAQVAGHNGYQFGLVRYHPSGNLDRSLGGDGRVVTLFADDTESLLYALDIAPDRTIVAGGWQLPLAGHGKFALARYTPDHGSLDPTFGGDGRVVTEMRRGRAFGLAFEPDGRIVAAGESRAHGVQRIAVARYQDS